MNVNLVYESKDFSSYTYESMQQRRQRVMQLDNELNACPFIELYEPSYENILTPTFGTNYLNNKGEKVFLNIHYATPAFFKLYDIRHPFYSSIHIYKCGNQKNNCKYPCRRVTKTNS